MVFDGGWVLKRCCRWGLVHITTHAFGGSRYRIRFWYGVFEVCPQRYCFVIRYGKVAMSRNDIVPLWYMLS